MDTLQNPPDKNKIYEIARHDSFVHHLVTMVDQGLITFEQAMIAGVIILSEQNAELQKLAVGLVATSAQITSPSSAREIGQGLSPEQRKDIQALIARAVGADVPWVR